MSISIFQRSSCLVRNVLCPDRQRIFICPCPSMIRMMKSDVCTRSLVRKLYYVCRCNMRNSASGFSSESKSSRRNQIDSTFRFSSESKSETYPDRFRCLVNQNPKSSDVVEFPVRDEFSDSSFSVQKKKRFLFPLLICLTSVLSCPP